MEKLILDEVNRRLDDQKEFINAKFTHLSAIVRLGFDDVNKKQDIANGRLYKVECQTSFIRWVHKRPMIAIPLMLILFAGVIFLVDRFGFDFLFKIM